MIQFRCQSCRQEMSVPDSLAGEFEACPACKTLVAVPGPYKPELPASWSLGRAASANAAKVSAAGSRARNLILGLVLASMLFGATGLIAAAVVPGRGLAEAVWMVGIIGMVVCAVVAFAAMPGAIARSRGLPGADSINALGVLGVFIPVVWLVALVMSLVMAPPPSRS